MQDLTLDFLTHHLSAVSRNSITRFDQTYLSTAFSLAVWTREFAAKLVLVFGVILKTQRNTASSREKSIRY